MRGTCKFSTWMVRNCINYAKNWFVVDRCCKLALFAAYIYVKKGHPGGFCIIYGKEPLEMTRI